MIQEIYPVLKIQKFRNVYEIWHVYKNFQKESEQNFASFQIKLIH